MREGKEVHRCGNDRREQCSGLATKMGVSKLSNRTTLVERTAHILIMTCSARLSDLLVQNER